MPKHTHRSQVERFLLRIKEHRPAHCYLHGPNYSISIGNTEAGSHIKIRLIRYDPTGEGNNNSIPLYTLPFSRDPEEAEKSAKKALVMAVRLREELQKIENTQPSDAELAMALFNNDFEP